MLDFASVLDPPLDIIERLEYCPFLCNMYIYIFWLRRKIKFLNDEERILDGLECSFYAENLKFALLCNTCICKLKVFCSPGLKSNLLKLY